jgi:hypothetical protein
MSYSQIVRNNSLTIWQPEIVGCLRLLLIFEYLDNYDVPLQLKIITRMAQSAPHRLETQARTKKMHFLGLDTQRTLLL